MTFSARSILEGAVYALEQCGCLLTDAALLLRARSAASALVLAAFGREELGRARILLRLAAEAEAGVEVTGKRIQTECGDHVIKQSWGQLSITQLADADSGLGKLHRAILDNPPNSEEYKNASARLEETTRRQAKRKPDERHQERMNDLYVEPSNSGWNRPSQVNREIAQQFVSEAIADYRVILHGDVKSRLNRFLAEWEEHPELPDPPSA